MFIPYCDMKDFRLYELTDFVMDEDFIRWVHFKSSADDIFWNNWLTQNPSKHLLIAEAKQIVESIRIEQKTIDAGEIRTEVENLLKTIRNEQQPVKPIVKPLRHFISLTGKWWRVAAILLLAIAGVYFFVLPRKDTKLTTRFAYTSVAASPAFTEKINASDKPITLSLPDGTIIELAANSRISYRNDFNHTDTRDLYLLGEAYFKIAKNPARPFRVFTNEIITKVLGTSFTVSSFEKDTAIRVTVRTGKVGVYSQIADNNKTAATGKSVGIIVTPNQQLVYQKGEQKFQKILIESPLAIVPDIPGRTVVYEDTPVESVFDQLGKYYGISIVFDNELLSKCTVTADLTNESFYQKLDLICKAIGAKYELVDGQVVIQSNGCQ
jgi:transmembrane sensor